MNIYFERRDNVVWVFMDSGLKTCRPVFMFGHACKDQESAELLTRHMNKEFDNFLQKVASDPIGFLDPEQISKVKIKLKGWHAGKHMWK